MSESKREVNESPLTQGEDERMIYRIDFTRWGVPGSPQVTLYDETTAMDVSSAKLEGSAGVAGNEVITPMVHSLLSGHVYRLVCQVLIDGNTMSAFCKLRAER